VDCLLGVGGPRHGVDDGPLQLRPSIDNIGLLHVGKLARTTTDIDGQSVTAADGRRIVQVPAVAD